MFCYLLLLITAMMMVKPVSTALFLAEFSAQHLPFVYILTAVLAALLSTLYSTLLRTHSLEKLMRITLGSAICLLLAFRGFIHIEWARGVTLYMFLVWAGLITLVCASQFWLAAGLFFNVREAKRLFGPIGSGAIIGGITGGYLTKFFAPVIGSQNLVFPAVCCLGAGLVIMERMWRLYGTEAAPPAADRDHPPSLSGSGSILPRIIKSPQLRLMAAILTFSVIAARLVDYQFNAIVSAVITDPDQLASFLGFWMSNLNILSLLIQVFATRIIIQRMGVGKALFFLPSGVLLGAAATFLHPALWPAVLIRLGEGCFKNSINKSGMELLFLTIPRSLKNQAKAFIDVFVDAAAGGIGGLVLLVSVYLLDMPPVGISLMLFCLVGGWMLLIRRVRKAYIRSFSEKLKPDSETVEDPPGPIPEDTRLIGRIIAVLDGSDETQILRMLRMISGYHNKVFDPSLVRLLDHPRPDIRTAALARLYFSRKTDVSGRALDSIKSGNIPLMTEAVRYLFHRSDDPVKCIHLFLANEDVRVRGAALLCLARETRNNRRLREVFDPGQLVEKTLLGAWELADTGRALFLKQICAAAIAGGDLQDLRPYLTLLMEDTDPGVVTAAIEAAGEIRDPVFVRALLSFLGRRVIYRQAAVTALKCHGEPLLDYLEQALSNPYMADAIRRHIPEIITGAGTQKAVDILSRQLMQPDLGIRHEIIRALNRLRISSRDLSFNKSFIIPKIKREAGEYMDLLTTLYAQKHMETGHGGAADGPGSS